MSQLEYEEKMFGSMYDANISESTMVELDKKKRDILAELEAAFKAAGLDVEIDTDSGKVGVEANFLFDTNSYELNTAGKQYIDTFVDVYTSVVLNGEHADYVAAIVVEGHTDTKGSYSYNQTLSQNRADAVAAQCIGRNPSMASMIA